MFRIGDKPLVKMSIVVPAQSAPIRVFYIYKSFAQSLGWSRINTRILVTKIEEGWYLERDTEGNQLIHASSLYYKVGTQLGSDTAIKMTTKPVDYKIDRNSIIVLDT